MRTQLDPIVGPAPVVPTPLGGTGAATTAPPAYDEGVESAAPTEKATSTTPATPARPPLMPTRPSARSQPQAYPQGRQPPAPAAKPQERATALYDFAPGAANQMALKRGDQLVVTKHINADWCSGYKVGAHFEAKAQLFPTMYVRFIQPA